MAEREREREFFYQSQNRKMICLNKSQKRKMSILIKYMSMKREKFLIKNNINREKRIGMRRSENIITKGIMLFRKYDGRYNVHETSRVDVPNHRAI